MNIVEGQGVPDFVMMNTIDEKNFVDNLKLRFNKRQIYTYIGEQVVSMNPFTHVDLYTREILQSYRQKYMYEVQPHIFALGEDTFRALMQTKMNQCVVITGESGAGKTEASKIFMQYIAAVSASRGDTDTIKSKLLDSNPVLEAFGNAKTIRNDNSSRFGKYMEIQFDAGGGPLGGKISQYLLEKSRVVGRTAGERSFHIFYELLTDRKKGGPLSLASDPTKYAYLSCSGEYKIPTLDDTKEFQIVDAAMARLGCSDVERNSVWGILAAILHLGNSDFVEGKQTNVDSAKVKDMAPVQIAAGLLKVDAKALASSLISRSIETGAGGRQNEICVWLDVKQSQFSRDSMAKALYDAVFTWVVKKINVSIESKRNPEVVIGVLDIYGFEILEQNSFEQFCINYCNEKLQQLFIEGVLKSEQEEYLREGIEWKEVKYFNNAPIVQLIEGKSGMYKLLDEACMVGQSTPMDVLNKFNNAYKTHAHYESFGTSKNKAIPTDTFRIKHYAGDVDYCVENFLYKNRDTLFKSLTAVIQGSSDRLMQSLFPPPKVADKKRPTTAGTQFAENVADLVKNLKACQPHYIRCIKSNNNRRGFMLDDELTRHQIRYLNLVETVRVRRAGFCNRQPYDRFLNRYKMISNSTWPAYRGEPWEGVQTILNELQIDAEAYRLGRTKLFIRDVQTLSFLEKNREVHMPKVAVIIQAVYRGHAVRKWMREHKDKLEMQKKANFIQKFWINQKIRRWIIDLQKRFAGARNAPNFGKGLPFPEPHRLCRNADTFLKRMMRAWWGAMKILAMTPENQALMRQKVRALTIFQGQKAWDCKRSFRADYLNVPTNPGQPTFEKAVQQLFQLHGDTAILFADDVIKVNKKGKAQIRSLLVTDQNIYKYDPKSYTMKKAASPLQSIKAIWMTPHKDTYCFIEMHPPLRDFVLDLGTGNEEKVSELVTILWTLGHRLRHEIPINFVAEVKCNNNRDEKDLKKPGADIVHKFEMKTGIRGCQYILGKNNTAVIQYPQRHFTSEEHDISGTYFDTSLGRAAQAERKGH